MARLRGWRTILVNVASIAFVGLVEVVNWLTSFSGWGSIFRDPMVLALFIVGINTLNIILRVVTTTPWGRGN